MGIESGSTDAEGVDIRADRACEHAELAPHLYRRWMRYGTGDTVRFAELVGLVVEEVRVDYCRMRLPWRTEISQPFGVAHGGAIAGLLDSVVVPAIGAGYDEPVGFATTDMSVQFLGSLQDEDAIAEGLVTKRGRTSIFCTAEVFGAESAELVARAMLTYRVLGAGGVRRRPAE
jgi:uncharacterized protein (TIGR00369 family)